MTHDSGLCTMIKKWIKIRMKTLIHLNCKGNEVSALCLFNVWLCLLLSIHHHCMCCHRQCLLHHICVSQVNNDDIRQRSEVVYDTKNIHSSLGVVREKVGDLFFNMSSILQNNSCNNILKYIVGYYTFILVGTLKQMST